MVHPYKQKAKKTEYLRIFRSFNSVHRKLFFALTILTLQSVPSVYAQAPSGIVKSSTITTVDGVQYYMHTVEKGQTVYAISKLYDYPINDIILENPAAINGVQPGTILKIPVKKTVKKTAEIKATPADTSTYFLYKVEKGQTLYSIAKKNNTTIQKINEINPQLSKNGLRAEEKIKIPKAGAVVIAPKVAPTATIAAVVPEKKLPVPTPTARDTVKKTVVRITPPLPSPTATLNATYGYPGEKKELYRIALFLPFHADEANQIGIERMVRGEDQFSNKTNIALQFYEGAMLAIDSLKKENLNAKVYVYDIDDDDSVGSILTVVKKPEMAEMDLIIGPLYASGFMPIAKFAKEHNIPIVSPFVQANKILFDNPYVCKITSSNTLQVMQMANFVIDTFYTQNIIIVNSGNKKEVELCTAFRKAAKETASNKMYMMADSVKEAKGLDQIKKYLHPTKVNVIVLPSNNQSYVTEFINMINTIQENRKIVLFGLQSWMNFDNLDLEYLNSLKLHIVSNNYINYNDAATKHFIAKFNTAYKSNPELYAFSGYDVTYYFLSSLQQYGKSFLNDIVDNKYSGIITNFNFIKSTTNKSGFENKFVYMLKYENYELKPAN